MALKDELPFQFSLSVKCYLYLFYRRHKSSNIDDGAIRSSQEMFLNLEKEHVRIAPQVGITGLRQYCSGIVLAEAVRTH